MPAAPSKTDTSILQPTRIAIEAPFEARLIRRYKRFLADVELPSGEEITVHCPNPGSMLGTQAPGSPIRCSVHDNPKRKLKHTLEMIRVGRCWVGLHAVKANAVAEAVLRSKAYAPFAHYDGVTREVKTDEGSRFDFRLTSEGAGRPPCWIEVKSVTLCEKGAARFPDAKSERAKRHLEHLLARHRAGERAALLYIAQRADARSVAPADDIDPVYGETLRRVAAAGVEVHALGARVGPTRIDVERVLPVLL